MMAGLLLALGVSGLATPGGVGPADRLIAPAAIAMPETLWTGLQQRAASLFSLRVRLTRTTHVDGDRHAALAALGLEQLPPSVFYETRSSELVWHEGMYRETVRIVDGEAGMPVPGVIEFGFDGRSFSTAARAEPPASADPVNASMISSAVQDSVVIMSPARLRDEGRGHENYLGSLPVAAAMLGLAVPSTAADLEAGKSWESLACALIRDGELLAVSESQPGGPVVVTVRAPNPRHRDAWAVDAGRLEIELRQNANSERYVRQSLEIIERDRKSDPFEHVLLEFDPAMGLAMTRMSRRHPDGRPKSDVVAEAWRLIDGVWLPARVTEKVFESTMTTREDRPLYSYIYTIDHAAVGPPPAGNADVFNLGTGAVGTIISHYDDGMYQQPATGADLDLTLDRLRRAGLALRVPRAMKPAPTGLTLPAFYTGGPSLRDAVAAPIAPWGFAAIAGASVVTGALLGRSLKRLRGAHR